MAHEGDKSKQPPECEPRFIRYTPENPRPAGMWGEGYWTTCPNLKNTYGDMDHETYECEVCGKYYNLYYEDMK